MTINISKDHQDKLLFKTKLIKPTAGRESSSRRPECEAGPSEHSDKFHLYEVPKIVQFIESETLLVDTRVCGVRMGVGRGDGELALKGDRVSVEEGEKFGRCIMVRVVQ